MNFVLKDFLSAAGVSYTDLYADSVFWSNPNRRNLLGLKQMLMHYGIGMEGIRVAVGQEGGLSFPCILHVGSDFVVATGLENAHIIYIEGGERKREVWSDFERRWDRLALVKTEGRGSEPDYERNRREERMERIPVWGLVLAICGMLAVGGAFTSVASAMMMVLAMVGFWMSFLLAEKETKGSSRVGDRLCRALGEHGCKGTLSKEGRVWGALSLSSVGLGYFGGQMMALSLLPGASIIVTAIGVVAVLFCPWSIVVQWKLKQWCVLCLLVVAVLVLQGGVSIVELGIMDKGMGLTLPGLDTDGHSVGVHAASVMLLMGFGIVVAHWVTQGEKQKQMARREKWAFRAFRNEPAVLAAKLRSKAPVGLEERDVTQRVGSSDAPHRLTMVTSADCPHCQNMKPRIEQMTRMLKERLCVDYIALSDKTDEEVFEFIQRTGIRSTPTLLMDGYLLPREYEVEEVGYICCFTNW